MACSNCASCADLTTFYKVESDDSEYYIEKVRSSWSIITPVSANPVTNLWTNPSFEGSGGTWTNGASVTDETAYAGVNSLKFYDISQFSTPWLSSGGNLFPRTSGITYCVSMWVKTCCDHTLRAGVFNAVDGWMAYGEVTGNGCWQQLSFCVAADAGPTLVSDIITSYFTLTSDLQCTENYVDQITVTATSETHFTATGATDTSYCECYEPFDGDSVNASWNGTPHASTSTMKAYSRTGGKKTPLSDFGFQVIAFTGHGVPPVVTSSTQYARRSGASVQRARANSRTVTITGELCGCSWKELSHLKSALVDALGLDLSGTCSSSREIYLAYECVDDCGEVFAGKDLRLKVNYNGGLDGSRSRPYCERITLSFIANSDPMFVEGRQYCKVLVPGVEAKVKNCGNASADVRLFGRNRGGLNLTSLTNVTTGSVVKFGDSVTGYTAGADVTFTNVPGNTSFTLIAGSVKTDISNQMSVSGGSKPTQFTLAPGTNTIRLDGSLSGADSEFVLCWRNKFMDGSAACTNCECAQPD